MEKRFYLGVAILALLLTICIIAAIIMALIHQPMETDLQEAAGLALSNDLERALPLAQRAYDRWETYHGITASFADHSPMDDTDTLFQEMLVYGHTEEIPHFAACCRQLAVMTQAMYDAHVFSLKNFL